MVYSSQINDEDYQEQYDVPSEEYNMHMLLNAEGFFSMYGCMFDFEIQYDRGESDSDKLSKVVEYLIEQMTLWADYANLFSWDWDLSVWNQAFGRKKFWFFLFGYPGPPK